MARATLSKHRGILRSGIRQVGAWVLVLAAVQGLGFLILGCDTGSRRLSSSITDPNMPTAGNPFLADVVPGSGCAGDTVTLEGFNFDVDNPENNIVTFSNNQGLVELRARVIDAVDIGGDVLGRVTNLTVLVPTGVRSGFVTVQSPSPETGELVVAGSQGFSACPVVVGYALGNNATTLFVAAGMTFTPDEIVFYGYNLSEVTGARLEDSTSAILQASVFTGLPAGVNYSIPPGMQAVRVEIPSGLVIDCASGLGPSAPMTLTLQSAGGTGFPIDSNEVQVQFTVDPVQGMPAAITGAFVPTGIRSGDIPIHFNLAERPAKARWDVLPMYLDPGTGDYEPCTPAPASRITGVGLFSGNQAHRSAFGAIITPGHGYTFIWDSAADLPNNPPGADFTVTNVLLVPTNPLPALGVICSTSSWTTEPIVVDNGAVPMGSIVELFNDNQFEDADGTDALWASNGRLVGNPTAAAFPAIGDGTVDVELISGRTYVLDTGTGTIVDETDLNNPQVLLSPFENPGSDQGEFHVRTFVLNPDVNLIIPNGTGSNPVIIRAAGTENVDEVAVRIAGDIDLSGESGAIADAGGTGGAGGPGGGNGGNGGIIEVMGMLQTVIGYTNGTPGGNSGGQPGSTITHIEQMGLTVARSGSGGGGGYGTAGAVGIAPTQAQIRALSGLGGRVRGDAELTLVTGGSGGGGGGALPYRPQQTAQAIAPRNGGGGGGGGGALEITSGGGIVVTGSITSQGGDGGNGGTPTGGSGGGGSGGAIALRARGDIQLGSSSLIVAKGGIGGVTASNFEGGRGGDGRVRLEANGSVNLPGLVVVTGVKPPVGSSGITAGLTADPVAGGTGVDGSLDLTGSSGTFTVNTNDGTIIENATGNVVRQAVSGAGEFQFASLTLPAEVTLRGVGNDPLILRVSGDATIRGTIDVSGFAGGLPNFADPDMPLAGAGGAGGPGAGSGGQGGLSDLTAAVRGAEGGLPPGLPADLIGLPLGDGATGDPVPVNLAYPAVGGGSVVCDLMDIVDCHAGSGGGGGYGVDGKDAGVQGTGTPGIGGTKFGSSFFLHPITGTPLLVGGPGGAGGGGNNITPDGVSAHAPGSGGGGGGGMMELSVDGVLFVASGAQLLARGGDAFQSVTGGGNGGAGAGGGVRIRGDGLIIFEADPNSGQGPTISVLGGTANRIPPDPSMGGYVGNGLTNAGDGGSGRIRIESPVGINLGIPPSCTTVPQAGICPTPTVGPFGTAEAFVSTARSRPYPVLADGSLVRLVPVKFGNASFNAILQPGTSVRLLLEGANESTDTPGVPGPFFGPVGDPSVLNGFGIEFDASGNPMLRGLSSEFIRLRWFLYSASTAAVPAIEDVSQPFAR